MGSESIECISSSDGIDEDEIQPHPPLFNIHSQFSSSAKTSHNINHFTNHTHNNNNNAPLVPPSTSVHELLECPVCTNSMYPPIHQVLFLFSLFTFWVSIISVLLFSFLTFTHFQVSIFSCLNSVRYYFFFFYNLLVEIFFVFAFFLQFISWKLLIVIQICLLYEWF